MDKSFRVAKFNIIDMRKRMIWFYLITSIVLMFFVNIGQYGDILLPAVMDILTFLFLISCAMNTLKNKFNFAQGNNISRNAFIKGSIISIFPIAALMAVIDFAINRTLNVYIKSPTVYDMVFTSGTNLTSVQERLNWIQDGSINAIVGSIIFSFLLYILASAIGSFMGAINLRSSEKIQLLWAGLSTGFWIYWFTSDDRLGILDKIRDSIDNRAAWAVFIYILMFISCIYGSWKLIRKAIVN